MIQVSLDTFNTFLRFLYAGNLEHVPQLVPATVTSLMLLVQWYKLQLVEKRGKPLKFHRDCTTMRK